MDRQITFIEKVIGSNSTNENEVTSWDLIDSVPTVWAKVSQKGGKEAVVADQIRTVFNSMFVIDYREDITEEMRIVYNSKVFDIIGIIEHEESRDRYLQIQAEYIPNETFTIPT